MARRFRLLTALVVGALCSACASGPPLFEFVDGPSPMPAYTDFVAYAAFEDLALQAAFERGLCRRLVDAGHGCRTLQSLIPPMHDADGAARHAATRQSGAEATLVIELLAPDTISRRMLANGRPAYRVSMIDNAAQRIVAVFAVEGDAETLSPAKRARGLAGAIVEALARGRPSHSP